MCTLTAPFRIIRAASEYLRETAKREKGDSGRAAARKIVNVSSTTGTRGNAGQTNYAAGKAGIVGVTKTLAKEWGQFNIQVNAVAFGFIETRLTAGQRSGRADRARSSGHRAGNSPGEPRNRVQDDPDWGAAALPKKPLVLSSSFRHRSRTTFRGRYWK